MHNSNALRHFLCSAALLASGTAQSFASGDSVAPSCLSNQMLMPGSSRACNHADFLVQNAQNDPTAVPHISDQSAEHTDPAQVRQINAQSTEHTDPAQVRQIDAQSAEHSDPTAVPHISAQSAGHTDSTRVPNISDQSAEQTEPSSKPNAPFSLQIERREVGVKTEGGRFNLSEQQQRELARFRLELIIDRSLSMAERDCPGNQTRWHWCGMQAEDLAKLIAPYSKDGVSVTSFAWRYDVVESATPDTIEQLFSHDSLGFGTRLSGPLKNRLGNFFAHQSEDKRPMLLAVITDGVPVPPPEPIMVHHVLKQAAKKIDSPGQVTVVFFQIGKVDLFGKLFLHQLERDVRGRDKEHPLVQYVSFKELERTGLARALVQVIENSFPPEPSAASP